MNSFAIHRKLSTRGLIFSCLISFSVLSISHSSYAETTIERLVKTIVRPENSHDYKMFKLEQWVNRNISYTSDKKQFNMAERWTLPTETLQRKRGDCEDGSILLISLAVTAGIPAERLRLYAPIKVPTGWHACVAYKRESDDRWVWMEWAFKNSSYYETIDRRKTLTEINAYVPLGTYFTVTSLNPFNMVLEKDDEYNFGSSGK